VGTAADESLDQDLGAAGLEGDAVVAVFDVGVLDYDVAAFEGARKKLIVSFGTVGW
jgi:hypothetical protein